MANKRLVMVTSTGCLDYVPELIKDLDIDIIRVHLSFKGVEYLEGYDLNPVKYYEELENLKDAKNNLPKTSMPSIAEINKHFDDAIANGYDEALVITISTGLSGTYGVIKQAAEAYQDKIKITVFDTKTNSLNEGMHAVKAAQLIKEGVATEDIIKELEWIQKTQEFFGIDGKLDYLIYNGRLKGGKALIGKMLSICPVVGFGRDGVLTSWETVRTQKKAIARVCEIMKEKIGDRDPKDYMLWHCYTGPKFLPVIEEIEAKYGIKTNTPPIMMSPSSGSHNGPWFIGYGYMQIRREDEPLED